MQDNLKKVGAKVYLSDDEMLIQKVTYIYENGTESEPLSRFVHLGMFTDSILFGDECDIRFFVYQNLLKLYDTDVDAFEFINNSHHAIEISYFNRQIVLESRRRKKLINTGDE